MEDIKPFEYFKPEIVRLKDYKDEKWLQERIEEDTSLLDLGELVVIERERKQSSGGRIDFLLYNPETQTMYETEIMLGTLDESHIIRTIEYWDIERRRFPSRDHRAVIVAEEITNRFFNVISLMNRAIPIIAIQLTASRWENRIALTFTKVLDIYEEPEDEDFIPGETVDRSYWEKKSNPKSIAIMDEIIGIVKKVDENPKLTYNRGHVALGTHRRNFCWFHPRKKDGYCHVDIRVGKDNLDDTKELLEEIGISFNHKREDVIGLSLHMKTFLELKEELSKIVNRALKSYS